MIKTITTKNEHIPRRFVEQPLITLPDAFRFNDSPQIKDKPGETTIRINVDFGEFFPA